MPRSSTRLASKAWGCSCCCGGIARKPRPRGAIVGLGLVYYAVVRSIVELVRVPDAQIGYLAGDWLTMGQLLSLPMFLAGAVLLLRAKMQPQPSGNYSRREALP